MRTTKHFIAMLLCALLSAPATLAQNPQRNGQTDNAASQDVLIIIQQQQVRFTAQKAVQEMQLQVINQSGEVVYDSGVVAQPEINWPLQNGNGEDLKNGLYAYTLSIKEVGAETARVRRGHFIVDRVKERDGTDKLWVTSQSDGGVGTELTVARDENATVAGTVIGAGRTVERRQERTSRDGSGRGVEPEARDQAEANKAAGMAAAGTAGQIAKFTSATDLGDSVMSEVNGNVGIGTTSPSSKLTVQTPTATFGFSHTDGQINLSSWVGRGQSGGDGGWFGTRSNHGLHFFTNNSGARMMITPSGTVGIGTPAPAVPGLHIGAAVPGGQARLQLDNANGQFGGLNRWTNRLELMSTNAIGLSAGDIARPHFWLEMNGNIGIGTGTPSQRLDVAGNINYGQLTKLDVAPSPYAFIRAADLLLGHPDRRGVPGRALVDAGGELVVNFARDWARTTVGSDLNVLGRTRTTVLEITGGADFAENFDVNVAEETEEAITTKVEAGMVVSIDPANPGKLQLSTQAYDSQVAGIISGAGGVKPGMVMSQEGTLAEGKYPVALSGRVYCWVDASSGAVKPGDLLTTSATPGHAMKATDPARAQGAIIGKAMTGLKEGKGLVLVLVTLQ